MPVFTTTSASIRARRSARLSINTASAQPEATTPSSPNPTSPDSLPLPESESITLKAKRAYERDRQRVKKRKERALVLAENNPASDARHARDVSDKGRGGAKPRERRDAARAEDKGRDAYPTSPQVEDIIADVVERAAQAKGAALPSQPLEVHLDELMRPGKARRSKAGEFELIPGMPVVIALDDQIPSEAELDEPWEHISADELDEKRISPPSYATVLANAI